jgi:hypothetical protein
MSSKWHRTYGWQRRVGDNTFQRSVNNTKAPSETTKLVVVDPSLVVRWKGRSFRFLSVYDHFVLRGTKVHFLSPRLLVSSHHLANVDYSPTPASLTLTFSSLC